MHELIYELAEFEKAPQEYVNTPEKLLADGFGPNPFYVCFVAEWDNHLVGMSLCYIRYSTWKGPCLYLEDLIVTESMRGKGIGKALLDFTIEYAQKNNFNKLQWQVLDWNESAIQFYKKYKSDFDGEWINVSITF
jgi:GNAT superfamily N-acetyltransferase